jgi:hypothetical protein
MLTAISIGLAVYSGGGSLALTASILAITYVSLWVVNYVMDILGINSDYIRLSVDLITILVIVIYVPEALSTMNPQIFGVANTIGFNNATLQAVQYSTNEYIKIQTKEEKQKTEKYKEELKKAKTELEKLTENMSKFYYNAFLSKGEPYAGIDFMLETATIDPYVLVDNFTNVSFVPESAKYFN